MALWITLKTDPQMFDYVAAGEKKFEIRKLDRNFHVGDFLTLKRTMYSGEEMANGRPLAYTGEEMMVRITHILKGPCYGLADGWGVLSIDPVKES